MFEIQTREFILKFRSNFTIEDAWKAYLKGERYSIQAKYTGIVSSETKNPPKVIIGKRIAPTIVIPSSSEKKMANKIPNESLRKYVVIETSPKFIKLFYIRSMVCLRHWYLDQLQNKVA